MNTDYKNVDDYINSFPAETQKALKKIRGIVQQNAPGAVESIAYGLPAYKLNGKPLIYFGAFKKHIGFYATPQGHAQFVDELSNYKQGKGSVQFPLSQPLPADLIKKMVLFKVNENLGKSLQHK